MQSFTSDKPFHGSFAVYICGIFVPAMSVTVQAGPWNMPQANIVIPTHSNLFRLGHDDRLQVAVFYKDLFYRRPGVEANSKAAEPTYRLLFDGEITSFSYNRSATNHNIQFSAVSHMQVFSELFIDFITTVNELAGNHLGTGETIGIPVFGETFPAIYFHKGLDPQQGFIKRPFDFIVNAIRALANDGIDPSGTDSRANSIYLRSVPILKFFDRHRKLVKLSKRFVACPEVESAMEDSGSTSVFPVIEVLQSQSTAKILRHMASGIGQKTSVWQLWYMTFQMMFYDLLMLPTPSYVLGTASGEIVGRPPDNLSEELANVTDDHLFKRAEEDEDGVELDITTKSPDKTLKLVIDKAYQTLSDNTLQQGTGDIGSSTYPYPKWKGKKFDFAFPQLAQFISKPHGLFAIPPRCNVIFPSMVRSINYTENFVTQATRMYLDHSEWVNIAHGSPALQGATAPIVKNSMRVAWPPQIDKGYRVTDAEFSVRNPYDSLVWPREYFQGIHVSRDEAPAWLRWITQTGHFRDAVKTDKLTEERVKELEALGFMRPDDLLPSGDSVATESPREIFIDSLGAAVEPSIRIHRLYARYRYHQERYSRRSGTIMMEFNPYIVPGMPLLYIDRESKFSLYAYVTSVSWNMAVGNMSTTVSFTYGRFIHENEGLLRAAARKVDPNLKKFNDLLVQPADPIYILQKNLQTKSGADALYEKMFWQAHHKYEDRTASAPYQYFYNIVTPSGNSTYPMPLNKKDLEEGKDTSGEKEVSTLRRRRPSEDHNLQVKDEFEPMLHSHEKAMNYIARPIVTIDEYCDFILGVSRAEGRRVPQPGAGEAKIYEKIRVYVPLDLSTTSGKKDTEWEGISSLEIPDEVQALIDARYIGVKEDGSDVIACGVDSDAEIIQDWPSRLLDYTADIMVRKKLL